MKTYEAMLILDNREVKKGWEPLKESVDSILTKRGAEIVVSKRWDERKLAYDIKKQRRATYYLSYFKAEPTVIDEVRRDLELSVPVLRYLILSCEAIPEDAYEPEREFTMAEDDEPVTAAASSEETDGEAADKSSTEAADKSSTEAADKSSTEAADKSSTEAAAEGSDVSKAEATTEPAVAEAAAPDAADAATPEETKE